MQKVTAFLERYVEWVAVALGGAFMLFMVFVYLIGTPISAKLGTTTVTLANVESTVYDEAGRKLEQQMADTAVPNATIEAYAANFQGFMAMKDVPLPQLATGGWGIGSPDKPLPKGPGKDDKTPAETKVQGLPGPLPAPKFYAFSEGRSNVQTDAAAAAPGGGAAFGPMAPMGMPPMMGAQGFNDEQGMPAAPAAAARNPAKRPVGAAGGAAGAAAAAAKPGGTDKIWVTQAFTIATDEIVDAFANAKIPDGLTTDFLRVEVLRQELMPDGSWGNETQIGPLPYHQVPAFPKPGAGIEERSYRDWAQNNVQTILVPSFYPKFAGDTWYAPGQPNPNKATGAPVRPVIAPVPVQPRIPGARGRTGMGGPPAGMGGPQGGGRSRGRSGGASYAPSDPERPSTPFMQAGPGPEAMRAAQEAAMRGQQQGQMMAQQQAAAAAARAGGQGGPPGMPGMGPGGFIPGSVPGLVGQVTVSVPDGYKVPPGNFVPAELDADIFGWFHDDTVEPGKTYHYKVGYKLLNPLYNNPKFGQLASVFAINSPMSEWSEPVVVDPITRFYVAAGVPAGASTVRFDVYHWQDGKWQTKQFTTGPGDEIGSADAGINYDTGWALADLDGSAMSREPVVIASGQGKLDSRSFPTDQSAQTEFKKEAGLDAPKAPPAGAPGAGPGFMPPGMGGPPAGFVPPGPPPGFMPPGMGGPPRR